VITAGVVAIESAASERVCVTPADTFAPAPATGLTAVASSGLISLIWNASSDTDLAGYLVLRGEAPGDTLQPLTAAPIQETTFRDTNVKAGTRYVYVVVAVDAAGNRSGPSNRVEETAR
jgi:fibronectin type 3 domain-containing protein